VPLVEGVPLNESVKKGSSSKRRYFDAIGSSSVKTVGDMYTHVAYHNKHWSWAFLVLLTPMTLNDLEPPKKGFFAIFSQCLAATHILRMNCNEMAGDGPKQPAYEIFNIERRL